jgi:hypothetical protein
LLDLIGLGQLPARLQIQNLDDIGAREDMVVAADALIESEVAEK